MVRAAAIAPAAVTAAGLLLLNSVHTHVAFAAPTTAGSARRDVYYAEVVDSEVACTVGDILSYQMVFSQGPNTCEVDPAPGPAGESTVMLSREYTNLDLTTGNGKFVPIGGKPFVFASGTGPDAEGGCLKEWLNDGSDNTIAQWDTLLDIGYTPEERCASVRQAASSTLLVWEAPANDQDVIWATWENVVPYMARQYGVANPAVTADTMKATGYAQFTQMQTADGRSYGALKDAYAMSWCASTYDVSSGVMAQAMSDPTGMMFRAALDACFSFFDVFTGNGYTYNAATGTADKCREYLYPSRSWVLAQPVSDGEEVDDLQAASEAVTVVALNLSLGANFVDQEQCDGPAVLL